MQQYNIITLYACFRRLRLTLRLLRRRFIVFRQVDDGQFVLDHLPALGEADALGAGDVLEGAALVLLRHQPSQPLLHRVLDHEQHDGEEQPAAQDGERQDHVLHAELRQRPVLGTRVLEIQTHPARAHARQTTARLHRDQPANQNIKCSFL